MFYTVSHTLTKAGGRGGVLGCPWPPLCQPFVVTLSITQRGGEDDNPVSTLCLTHCDIPLLKNPGCEERLFIVALRGTASCPRIWLSSIWSRVRDQRGNLSIRNLGANHYSLYKFPRERKNNHFQNQKHEHFQKTTPRHVQISLALDDWNFCSELISAISCLSNRRVTKR